MQLHPPLASSHIHMAAAPPLLTNKPREMAIDCLSESPEDSDVLMIDPFLDYINQILMEDGMDDATFMQQFNDDASYQAMFSSFQQILAEGSGSLSSCNEITTDNAIKFSDVEIPDTMDHAAVEDPNGRTSMRCQRQGNHNSTLPSKDEGLTEFYLSFEDLKLNEVYTDLYAGVPNSSSSSTAGTADKRGFSSGNVRKTGEKNPSEVQVFFNTKEVLVDCATAVARGDMRRANQLLEDLCHVHGACAEGTALQRVAHFFGMALAARMRGIGEDHSRALSHNMPSAPSLLRASKLGYEVSPFTKLMHYFANQSILQVAEGASRLHVVDFGLLYGMQWPCLINALADRKGGPPLLVITGVEFRRTGTSPGARLEESGRRLAAYAKTYNVAFQFHPLITDDWENVDAASLHLHDGDVLVINCVKCLRHLADETVDLASTLSPRQKFLNRMHDLQPHLLVTAVVNAAYNSPFFVSRFRDALHCYINTFDMLETLCGDTPQRKLLEGSSLYRDIVNIVGCEGSERTERPETYRQWHARIRKAGFHQLPTPPTILSRSRSHVKQHHHAHFLIDTDGDGWMLMGWKGRVRLAISAWKSRVLGHFQT